MVFNEQGILIARAKEFEEDMLIVDLDTASVFRTRFMIHAARNAGSGPGGCTDYHS